MTEEKSPYGFEVRKVANIGFQLHLVGRDGSSRPAAFFREAIDANRLAKQLHELALLFRRLPGKSDPLPFLKLAEDRHGTP